MKYKENKKIILAVAPVAHTHIPVPDGAKNPLTPDDVADEVLACADEGAAIVHLHVRDEHGEQTGDLRWFKETLDKIRGRSSILINGSTGGLSSLTLDERSVSVTEERVQIASLNMGSTNLMDTVYINTKPDIRYWAEKMQRHNVIPELEIFGVSMIDTCLELREQGLLPEVLHFNFCLGFPGALSANPQNLAFLCSLLPEGSEWGLIHEGMDDMSLLAAAPVFGARVVRVGFEDSFYAAPGKVAKSNAELVKRLRTIIELCGYEIATTDEAAELMGVAK